jgi:hypothetical protein
MLSYAQAERLATAFIEITVGDFAVIVPEDTVTRPYGWVFNYQSKKWIETRRTRDAIIGGTPFFIDRFTREIRTLRGPELHEEWFAAYEQGMLPIRLNAKADPPAR